MTAQVQEGRRFEGRAALITGAGSGIGRAVALRLAAEGARVFGVDVNGPALEEVAGEAAGSVVAHVADLSDPEACRATVEAGVAELGRLDVLGNIAGIAASSHFTDVTVEQYRRMMAINADACFFLCQAAIPHLLETKGNIVNLASNAGLMGQAYTVAYCMSKGATVQLTRALAREFIKTDLRVNAIAPAGVDTPLLRNFEIAEGVDIELMQPYMGFRGMSDADELARVFAFVASDEARSMHGAVISVDNAITAG
jgi:NAD(P)-dependent dehydrogenase (short-subunit alcohol dehydrogenase family)